MGIFKAIKEAIEFKKMIKESVKEYMEKEALYVAMSTEELAQVDDDELIFAAMARAENIVCEFEDLHDGLNALNDSQRILYALNTFDMEVNNGGICQFFVNSSRAAAPFISEYMEVIDAKEHQKTFDDFIAKYEIDLNDLSSFDSDTAEEFSEQYERYPFDEYDDAFYEMEPLETYLIPYIKANIDKF